ncbi:MAG TPA: UDP-N-acetylmuramate dehydrogenase [Ktedonobacteraceae bacterium]|nr:UDP-N-acetylmuramate dehydrogenase [Ktedonobacteraceae bacterium]
MTFDAEKIYQELYPRYQGRVRRNESLSRHGTFGVGGPADVWVTLERSEEVLDLVGQCMVREWPLLLVGNGTNVLYADAGARGIVARLALNEYSIEEQEDRSGLLVAGAGVSWPRLLNDLASLGWGGLEFGPGIPGTLGGGVVSNAGAHFGNIGEVLEWVDVVDARASERNVPELRHYVHDELHMSYRHSRFRSQRRVIFDDEGQPVVAPRELIEPGEIITRLGVRLHRADPQTLRERIEEFKQHRKRTQPPQQSAGSVFKNPEGDYAARLIEQAGLKGQSSGKARISERHANFIVNAGGASAADVVALVVEARKRVKEQFGVELELEVELRGAWGKTSP